jgi:hypothetical protein
MQLLTVLAGGARGDDATWVLGDVKPGEERKITFKGRMYGNDNQERNFRFYTGTEDTQEKTNIGTIFVTNSVAVSIKKPFLATDIAIDDKSTSVVTALHRKWQNILLSRTEREWVNHWSI